MPGPLSLVRLPLQIGLRAGAVALQLGAGLVRHAVGIATPRESTAPPPPPDPPTRPAARVTISSPETPVPGRARKPRKPARPRKSAPARKPAPTRKPARPSAPPAEPDHVSEEAVPVASFAEPGAEDTPGPQIQVAEPWEGYDRLRAREVQQELARAGREAAAAVVLYEAARRGRQTVVAAAERRLAELDAAARP